MGIESGSFLDVLELDAASNNGVDQVRALRDEAIYSPANVRKRVYIVDEVHMLSTPAFNALLKILEEPPEHLMFILATTELHKVPATILSRCQRFSFRRITPADISARLQYVASQEGIDLREDGAELLSRLADGALRDALSLLDQCAASGGQIDSNSVLEVLGLAGNLQTAQLMEHILRRDSKAALLLLHQLYTGGKDVGAVLGELSTLTRDLLLRRTAPEGGAALPSRRPLRVGRPRTRPANSAPRWRPTSSCPKSPGLCPPATASGLRRRRAGRGRQAGGWRELLSEGFAFRSLRVRFGRRTVGLCRPHPGNGRYGLH